VNSTPIPGEATTISDVMRNSMPMVPVGWVER
jgi:hypothetical protein